MGYNLLTSTCVYKLMDLVGGIQGTLTLTKTEPAAKNSLLKEMTLLSAML